jgi:hypothetical protein
MDTLDTLPLPLLFVVVVGGSALLSVAGLWLMRRFSHLKIAEGHNEVAGFIFATVGVVYAVLLVFLTIVVFQQFAQAEHLAADEAATLLALYRDTEELAEPTRQLLQERLRAYTRLVVEDEWRAMADGHEGPQTERAFGELWHAYGGLKAGNAKETALYVEAYTRLNDLTRERTLRVLASKGALPSSYLFVLVAGAGLTIAFTYLFAMADVTMQALMTALLGVLIGAILFLVLAVNRPFSGDVSVSPEAFVHALEEFDDQAQVRAH